MSDRICLDWPVVISRMGKPGLAHDNKTVTQYVEFNFYSENGGFQLLRSLRPPNKLHFYSKCMESNGNIVTLLSNPVQQLTLLISDSLILTTPVVLLMVKGRGLSVEPPPP